jgi:hypothetical protein
MSITAAPTPSRGVPMRPHAWRSFQNRPVLAPEAHDPYGEEPLSEIPPSLARLLDLPAPDDPTGPAITDDDRDAHPFGLPVLSEVPQLATMLQDLRQVDRLLSGVVDAILLLEDEGLAEAMTGLGIDTWLSIIGRRTGADTRMLRTTALTMRRVPTLHGAFQSGAVSWAQVRSVVLAVRPFPRTLDGRIDAAIADALNNSGADAEPDALTRTIRWHLAAIDPADTEADEREATDAEYLALQPRLDGTGGRFWGDLGPTNFAILDAALGAAAFPRAPGEPTGNETDGHTVRVAGRERLRRLIDHLDRSMSAELAGDRAGSSRQAATSGPMRSRAQLLLRADLSTLLDRDQTPAWLLTTLLGGNVRVTAATARKLIDERGADLRTVILDDTGSVVGVGRRARIAPGWLKDATLALHDTCATPGCQAGARRCETDHARPWHPARPGDPPGQSDIDQLAPGCSQHNQTKERDGWIVTQRADGTRRWHHPRTGLTTRTLPVPHRPPIPGSGRPAPSPP